MAMETSVSRMHSGRAIALAVLCLVFGLWGLYDYMIAIPNQAREAQLKQVVGLVQQALTSQDADLHREALAAIDIELQNLKERIEEAAAQLDQGTNSTEELRERLMAEEGGDIYVTYLLTASRMVLENRAANPKLTLEVNEGIDLLLIDLDEVTAPGKFDSAIQWLFILCLPLAFYFFWGWLSVRGQRYILNDDGSLQTPQGRIEAKDMADIDMSRWMAKSIATLVLVDGAMVKLDAYIHVNLDKIVGILAHKFHPDQWTEEAKPVKPASSDAPAPEHEGAAEKDPENPQGD